MKKYQPRFANLMQEPAVLTQTYYEALSQITTYSLAVISSMFPMLDTQEKWYLDMKSNFKTAQDDANYWTYNLLPRMHDTCVETDVENMLFLRQTALVRENVNRYVHCDGAEQKETILDETTELLKGVKQLFANRRSFHETILHDLDDLTKKFKTDLSSYAADLETAVDKEAFTRDEIDRLKNEIEDLQKKLEDFQTASLVVNGAVVGVSLFCCFLDPFSGIIMLFALSATIAAINRIHSAVLESEIAEKQQEKSYEETLLQGILSIETLLRKFAGDEKRDKLLKAMAEVRKAWVEADDYLEQAIDDLTRRRNSLSDDYLIGFMSGLDELEKDVAAYYENQKTMSTPIPTEIEIIKIA